jgi:hypothetical protein
VFLSNTLAHQNNEKIQNSFAPVHILGSLLNSIHTVNMLAYCSLLNRPECFQTICLNPFEFLLELQSYFLYLNYFALATVVVLKRKTTIVYVSTVCIRLLVQGSFSMVYYHT